MQSRIRRSLALAAFIVAVVASADARAGQSGGQKGDGSPPQHLLGDWGGLRPALEKRGVDLSLDYIAEPAWDVSGGRRRGGTYVGQGLLGAVLDGDRLFGLPGLTLHLGFVERHGRNLSAIDVGDAPALAQGFYGGDPFFGRLAYLYARQTVLGGRLDLAAGRLPMEMDFGTLPHNGEFMALGINAMLPLNVESVWTAFPGATWGGRAFWQMSPTLALRAGLYEANATSGGHYGYDWSTAGAAGLTIPAEIVWTPGLGANGDLGGTYMLGGYVSLGDWPDWYEAVNGLPRPLTSAPARSSNRSGFWLQGEQTVWRAPGSSSRDLSLLAGFVYNAPRTSRFEKFGFLGLIAHGPLPDRPHDTLGMSVYWARVSHDLTRAQRLDARLGLPLEASAAGVETDEVSAELNYRIRVAPGVEVMPDLQYVVRPGASGVYPDALIAGVLVKLTF